MPHSIFFTKIGHAIHGTDSVNRLGIAGFAWLRAAVARERLDAVCAGARARRAQHHGDADRLVAGRAGAQSATARQYRRRPPRRRSRNMTAAIRRRRRSRRDHAARRSARRAPQARADDGYIYPGRRLFERSALSGAARPPRLRHPGLSAAAPQPQYYDNRGYAPAPQGYYYPAAADLSARLPGLDGEFGAAGLLCGRDLSRPSRSQAAARVAPSAAIVCQAS